MIYYANIFKLKEYHRGEKPTAQLCFKVNTEGLIITHNNENNKTTHVLKYEGAKFSNKEGKLKVPLLDSHKLWSVSNVLGSVSFDDCPKQEESPRGGKKELTCTCTVRFADTERGKAAARNVKEGHLVEFSIGFVSISTKRKTLSEIGCSDKTIKHEKWQTIEVSIIAFSDDAEKRSVERGIERFVTTNPGFFRPFYAEQTGNISKNTIAINRRSRQLETDSAIGIHSSYSSKKNQNSNIEKILIYGFIVFMALSILFNLDI